MDEARIERLGAKPIASELARIRAAKTRDDLAALMGQAHADFYGTLFNFGIDVDLKDPTHYAVYVTQGGLGLPDRDYYLQTDFAKQKAKYQAYVAKLLHLAGWPDAGCARQRCRRFRNQDRRRELDQNAGTRSRCRSTIR